MLRTAIMTLAAVTLMTALGTWGLAYVVDAAGTRVPPIAFSSLRVVRAGAELTDVWLLHSRVQARARGARVQWTRSVRPEINISGLDAQAGPVTADFDRIQLRPTDEGWRIEGVGRIQGEEVDFQGQIDLAARTADLIGASGPLFRGQVERADVQIESMHLDASDAHEPSIRLIGVDARRGRAWWGGGQVDLTRAPCGLRPTVSGGQAWYGAGSDSGPSDGSDGKPAGPSPAFGCPVRVSDMAVQVATPIGVRHLQVHAADFQADSIAAHASGPEGAGTLVADIDRQWVAVDGRVDLAQLPAIQGVSTTGAARGHASIVRMGETTFAHVRGQVDGQLEHPAIANEPVDLSGTTLEVDIEHRAGHLTIDVADVQRGGVHASARIIADADTVDLKAHLAPTTCQAFWTAIPAALRGPYADAQLSGEIAPQVHFHLPRANAKTLTLVWKGPSDCVVDALRTHADHLPAVHVSGARDDVDWLLRDFRMPIQYATRPVEVGPGTASYVAIGQMPRWVGAAAIVSEDNSFNRGKALNLGLLRRALMFNLDRGRYVYGGSTIPQQLAKNLFLTRQKTLARKLQEAIVALRMVQVVPTRRILELYLNCIEFAPNVYGIERAARHYFQKGARRLTPKESAFLGISKPSPRYAAAMRRRGSTPDTPHFREYMRRIIERMRKRGAINSAQAAAARPFRIRWRAGRKISQAENRPQDDHL